MTGWAHAQTWLSLMAVMGESGTLRERLPGTVAAGRFHGKTGTLRDVIALSGTVIGDDGPRYHLAVIANEADGPGRWVARTLMDELVLQLSADRLPSGCTETRRRGARSASTAPAVRDRPADRSAGVEGHDAAAVGPKAGARRTTEVRSRTTRPRWPAKGASSSSIRSSLPSGLARSARR
jgi:hypothetical protein